MTDKEKAEKILGLISSEHLNVPASEVSIMHACQEWMREFIGEEDGQEESTVSP